MSTGFKRFLLAIVVAQLALTTWVSYKALALAENANMKACFVATMALGADYEQCAGADVR